MTHTQIKNTILERLTGAKLYCITIAPAQKQTYVEMVEMACRGGADVIQLRDKNLPVKTLISLGKKLSEICHRYGTLFVVNDRLDVALACGADGVHLGQDDLPLPDARRIVDSYFSTSRVNSSLTLSLLGTGRPDGAATTNSHNPPDSEADKLGNYNSKHGFWTSPAPILGGKGRLTKTLLFLLRGSENRCGASQNDITSPSEPADSADRLGNYNQKLTTHNSQLTTGFLVGCSTHSLEQALKAQEEGADYIGCGPVFSTPTKPDYPAVGLELVRQYRQQIRIPFVAIGGIDETNVEEVIQAGARCVAVVRAVFGNQKIEESARSLKNKIIAGIRESLVSVPSSTPSPQRGRRLG